MKVIAFFTLLFTISLSTSINQHQNDLNQTLNCISNYLQTYQQKINPKIYRIFLKSFPNTLTTTIQNYNLSPQNPSTYIITGDIKAMWLRDSTNQFIPYIRMPIQCPNIRILTRGLLNTQAEFIMTDGYTNAYKKYDEQRSGFSDISQTLFFGIPVDLIRQKQHATHVIWQRKFEIDSLASFLRLSHEYYSRYNSIDFINLNYIKSLKRILTVLKQQTLDNQQQQKSNKIPYTFYRDNYELPQGRIGYSKATGMIKTGFRPSDSPNQLPYNIPGNAMMSTYLKLVAEDILDKVESSSVFKDVAVSLVDVMLQLSNQIISGIYQHGIITQSQKQIFAYEVDGFGNYRLYDDANLPSLLSLPYFNFLNQTNQIYQNTRTYILSHQNQYYYSKNNIAGIGSSHTYPRYIWPLALITQILTAGDNQDQMKFCIDALVDGAKDDLMHQSFCVDDVGKISREWFAWANSFFGEMVMYLAQKYPDVLK